MSLNDKTYNPKDSGMIDYSGKTDDSGNPAKAGNSGEPPRKQKGWRTVGIVMVSVIGGIIFLAVAVVFAIGLYLTPERISKLISQEVSKYLYADVTIKNPQYTLLSSFPDLHIEIDSVSIKSTVLNNIDSLKNTRLSRNAENLASTGKIEADLNVIDLLKGDISIGEVYAGNINLNLVQISDSIANFYILKSKPKKSKIPEIDIKKITLSAPVAVKFSNVAKGIGTDLNFTELAVKNLNLKNNSYALRLGGDISLYARNEMSVKDLPFSIAAVTDFDFNPFSLSVTNGNIRIADLGANINTRMSAPDNLIIHNLNCHIDEFSVNSLMKYLPENILPLPETIETDVRLMADLNLTEPYTIPQSGKISTLPSVSGDVKVSRGQLTIIGPDGKRNLLNHGDIVGKFAIDGRDIENTYVEIPQFNVSGDGTDMKLKAYVSDLLDDPEIHVSAVGNTKIALAGHVIKPLRQYKPTGKISTDAIVSFRMSNMKRADMADVRLKGDIQLNDYSVFIPQNRMKASGNMLALKFGTSAKELSPTWVDNGVLDINLKSDSIRLENNNLSTNIGGLQAIGHVTRKSISAPQKFDFKVSGEYVDAIAGNRKFTAEDFAATFNASKLQKKIISPKFKKPDKWTSDSRSMAFVGHTSEYLTVDLPRNIKDLLSLWKTHLSLKVKTGEILTPELPLHNGYGDFELEASVDSINLKHLDLNSQDTRLHVNARVSNLRQFLTSGSVAPLRMGLNVAIDTVQINQLAGAYNRGLQITHGPKASVLTVIPDTLTPGDTLSLLIPRNIYADINASAMMTKYTDLEMHDLTTSLAIRDGKLKINDLGITTGFGALKMNFTFDTSDIQRMGMNMEMGLADVNLVNFFSNFHTLLLMMPQMKNIKGDLSVLAEAKLLLFPNMYFNMPSIWADLYVNGKNLSLHQDKFIRRITRMMLIRDKGDIRLSDMNIHASVHDNLMELYPFDISFNNYSLQFGGLNNFDGEMYYHLGINKSPVPFPFGINIKGDLKHPEIRFGGASYKVDQGEQISSYVMEKKRINLPLELKCLVREIIEKAALADTTPASFYVY